MIATSMSSEPRKVYRKNFTAEYTLRPCPQMPIRNSIGISIASQKR